MAAALALALALAASSPTWAAGPEGGEAKAAALTLGPYLQDVRTDGAAVVFETDREVEAEVEAEVEGAVVRVRTPRGTHHVARLNGLPPSTRASYRVRVGGVDLDRATLTTAPGPGERLDFVVYGDTRNGGEVEARLARAILADAPDLVVHTGDLVPRGDDEESWRGFFAREAPLLREVPFYLAVGNHELYGDPGGDHLARYFVLPEEGQARRYYQFAYGPARFVVLDGNLPSPEQTAWLGKTLEAAELDRVRHVFVFVHQATFSSGGHCGAAAREPEWVRLFERHRVRAVFGGHDHGYQRLERGGVRYFVTGGGGAPLYPEEPRCPAHDRAALRRYEPVYHHLRVRVRGDAVEVAVQPLDGGRPLEVVALEAPLVVAAVPEPPIVDDRIAASGVSRRAVDLGRRPWPIAVALGAAVVALGVVAFRRWRA